MCFMTTYSCEITCLNQELDMAAIVNGTIKGIGSLPNSCHTVCTQITTESELYGSTPVGLQGGTVISFVPFIVCSIILAIIIVYYSWTKPKKPEGGENNGLLQEMPPTKPGDGTP